MAAVMEAGRSTTAALPIGVTARQVDENRYPLPWPNRSRYDPRWEHSVSHSVRQPEAVTFGRYDLNTPNVPGKIYRHRHFRDRDRHEHNPRPHTVDE